MPPTELPPTELQDERLSSSGAGGRRSPSHSPSDLSLHKPFSRQPCTKQDPENLGPHQQLLKFNRWPNPLSATPFPTHALSLLVYCSYYVLNSNIPPTLKEQVFSTKTWVLLWLMHSKVMIPPWATWILPLSASRTSDLLLITGYSKGAGSHSLD